LLPPALSWGKQFLKVHVTGCDIDAGPNHAFKFQLDEPLHALETMIIWQALTCFPAGTEHAAAGFLPNVRSLCAQLYTGDAQTMLDLGVAADLHFANFFLINEQEDLFGENDEDTPAYDNQLVVLQSSKLQFLQLQGPGNGDLLLEVRKVSGLIWNAVRVMWNYVAVVLAGVMIWKWHTT